MGIGVAAAADELQQIVYISGQMQCCVWSSSTGFIFKNSCYRLKLVSTTALYNQSSSIYIQLLHVGDLVFIFVQNVLEY